MNMNLQKIIARNLKALRKQSNLTQVQMAESIGLNRSTYITYELGRITPDPEILYRVAVRYGIKIDLLFEEKEEVFMGRIADSKFY